MAGFYEHWLILKFVRKTATEFLSAASILSHWLIFSCADVSLDAGKIFLEMNCTLYLYISWAVFETIFRITAGLRNKCLGNMGNMRLSECCNKLREEGSWNCFTITVASVFIETNTISVFYWTIGTLKNLKTISRQTESANLNFVGFYTIFISWPIPLKAVSECRLLRQWIQDASVIWNDFSWLSFRIWRLSTRFYRGKI